MNDWKKRKIITTGFHFCFFAWMIAVLLILLSIYTVAYAQDSIETSVNDDNHKSEAASQVLDVDKSKDDATKLAASKPTGKSPYLEEAVRHYNKAVELHQSGYLNPAIAEYKAAIEADDRIEEAYSNLGVIYASQKSYAKAIAAFNKALSLKPSRPTTLNGLGTVLYAQGKIKEAKDKWSQAIATDPNFVSAYYNIGNACEAEKDDTNAVNFYVKATEISPTMADAFYRIGNIFNKQKHLAQAKLLLSKAIELAPDADFTREAKKQLTGLNGQLNTNSDDDVDMFVQQSDNSSKESGQNSEVKSQ